MPQNAAAAVAATVCRCMTGRILRARELEGARSVGIDVHETAALQGLRHSECGRVDRKPQVVAEVGEESSASHVNEGGV